jgi:hypothetical protein
MTIVRLLKTLIHTIAALIMIASAAGPAAAQGHDDHGGPSASAQQPLTPEQNALVQAVREATERFKDVRSVAGPGEGYELHFGCVSGGDFGAMGLHYVNFPLVLDGDIDLNKPEIILFEPTSDGGIRITGADYVVLKADWDAKHSAPPQLMGQLFHLFDKPNRFGLDAFYTLHVWAWKSNPNGAFVNWNPNVSCDAFRGQ